jgi:hypothetical protein
MSDVIEVRFKIHKNKERELFLMMKKHDEVNWSRVSKKGIEEYCKERKF